MAGNPASVRSRLMNEIASLQGHKPAHDHAPADLGLGRLLQAFPRNLFPLAGVHEFSCAGQEELSASSAFVTGLLSPLLRQGGTGLWVSAAKTVFPPALAQFGVHGHQLIFLHTKTPAQTLWAVHEALHCHSLTAVVGELPELDFTASRRLQLAIEKSGVGCFLLRHQPRNLATACTCRWQVQPVYSTPEEGLPGVGHPRWRVQLHKVRNGKPGVWDLEWAEGKFRFPSKLVALPAAEKQKTG